jgi:plasmid stabilization system protein ParE
MTFHEDADSEMLEAALYYERRAPELGLAFLDEVERISKRIMVNPKAYQSVGDEVRQALLRRFPYNILYVIEPDDHIRIVAAAHQKRRPGYWRSRLITGS